MSNQTKFVNFEEHKVKTGETLDSLARQNGLTWQQLATFNFATSVPREINHALHEFTGCWKKTRDGKNYMFTSEDDPGIIFIPKKSPNFEFPTGDTHVVRVKLPVPYSQLDLETVDEFGHRVGSVTLVLKSEEGLPEVEITTDGDGYGRCKKLLSGRYRILVKGQGPAYYSKALERPKGPDGDPDYGEMVEAVVDTVNHTRVITRLVVSQKATEEELRQRRELKNVYLRTGKQESVEGRGEETRGLTHSSRQYAVDNLVLAAGWNSDGSRVELKRLASEVLPAWLKDYHPAATKNGYFVLLLEPESKTLLLMNQAGEVEDRFTLTTELRGLVGAYSVFEDVHENLFLDMSSMNYSIGKLDVDPDAPPEIFGVKEVVSDGGRLVERMNAHAREMPIVYYAPSASSLAMIALYGGAGRLEDYGHDEAVNDSIHQRNLAVCRSIRRVYESYVRGYVQKVSATKNEDELRELGPPLSPYEMPPPAGVTMERRRELLEQYAHVELEPWVAIAHQLDRFADRKSQGYPFFRIKLKYKQGTDKLAGKLKDKVRPGLKGILDKPPLTAEVEVETQMDIQLVDGQFEVVTKGDLLVKATLKAPESAVQKVTGKKFPLEVGFKQSLGFPEKQTVSVKVSKFQFETDTVGKTKLSLQALPALWADAEVNHRSGEFGGGVTIKLKDLAKALREKVEEYSWLTDAQRELLTKWASRLEGVELQIMLGFVGTREETILAVVSFAPGFFDRRSLAELFHPKTKWNILTFDEQRLLAVLGWTQESWDQKHRPAFQGFPESVGKTRLELTAEEKVAIVHLGFYSYEEYRARFEKHRVQFADYIY